jgi:pantetheine-phosphate adenylyltransferase
MLDSEIETVYLLSETEHTAISSSIVRELLKHDANIDNFIPKNLEVKKNMKFKH